MTHDELLAKINVLEHDTACDVWLIHSDICCGECDCNKVEAAAISPHKALRAVVELHKPRLNTVTGKYYCDYCDWIIDCQDCHIYTSQECEYPCPTIQAIEKELSND